MAHNCFYWEAKQRQETDAMSSREIWYEASKDHFQLRHLGRFYRDIDSSHCEYLSSVLSLLPGGCGKASF